MLPGRIGREMDPDGTKAKRYRERAEGLRNVSAGLPSNNTQRMLLGIALEYERLAGLLDERDASEIPTRALAAFAKPSKPDAPTG